MNVLFLTVTKHWFDEIKSGKKKIEYREYKQYWISRLKGKSYDIVEFRNGYQRNADKLRAEYLGYNILRGVKNPLGKDKVFAIHLGRLLNT